MTAVLPSFGTSVSAEDAATLNRRIDDLVAFQKRKAPWYRDTGLVISAAAFFISVMTTIVSLYRTHQQDINALKVELHNIIQQANSLILQNLELAVKYKDDNQRALQAASTLNTQNVVLAKQAHAVVRALGNSASSLDMTTTASALMQSSELILAEELLKEAVKRAENSVEDVAAWRSLASAQFQIGKKDEAKLSIENAFDVFKRYPIEANNKDYVNLTHAYTKAFWANVIIASDCQLAKQSVDEANVFLSSLPLTLPQANQIRVELGRLAVPLVNCSPA